MKKFKFFWSDLLLILLLYVPSYVRASVNINRIPTYGYCVDETCSKAIAEGLTTVKYFSIDKNVLSSHPNKKVLIFNRAQNPKDFTLVQIDDKRGFFPPRMYREMKIFHTNAEVRVQFDVSTNITINAVPTNTSSENGAAADTVLPMHSDANILPSHDTSNILLESESQSSQGKAGFFALADTAADQTTQTMGFAPGHSPDYVSSEEVNLVDNGTKLPPGSADTDDQDSSSHSDTVKPVDEQLEKNEMTDEAMGFPQEEEVQSNVSDSDEDSDKDDADIIVETIEYSESEPSQPITRNALDGIQSSEITVQTAVPTHPSTPLESALESDTPIKTSPVPSSKIPRVATSQPPSIRPSRSGPRIVSSQATTRADPIESAQHIEQLHESQQNVSDTSSAQSSTEQDPATSHTSSNMSNEGYTTNVPDDMKYSELPPHLGSHETTTTVPVDSSLPTVSDTIHDQDVNVVTDETNQTFSSGSEANYLANETSVIDTQVQDEQAADIKPEEIGADSVDEPITKNVEESLDEQTIDNSKATSENNIHEPSAPLNNSDVVASADNPDPFVNTSQSTPYPQSQGSNPVPEKEEPAPVPNLHHHQPYVYRGLVQPSADQQPAQLSAIQQSADQQVVQSSSTSTPPEEQINIQAMADQAPSSASQPLADQPAVPLSSASTPPEEQTNNQAMADQAPSSGSQPLADMPAVPLSSASTPPEEQINIEATADQAPSSASQPLADQPAVPLSSTSTPPEKQTNTQSTADQISNAAQHVAQVVDAQQSAYQIPATEPFSSQLPPAGQVSGKSHYNEPAVTHPSSNQFTSEQALNHQYFSNESPVTQMPPFPSDLPQTSGTEESTYKPTSDELPEGKIPKVDEEGSHDSSEPAGSEEHTDTISEAPDQSDPLADDTENKFSLWDSVMSLFSSGEPTDPSLPSEDLLAQETISPRAIAAESYNEDEKSQGAGAFLSNPNEPEFVPESLLPPQIEALFSGLGVDSILTRIVAAAVTLLLCIIAYFFIEKKRMDSSLVARVNNLERELMVLSKENTLLKDESLASIDQGQLAQLLEEISEAKTARAELEEQVATLERDLDEAAETNMELNQMLAQTLESPKGSADNVLASVERLQAQLDGQRDTINNMKRSISTKNAEIEALKAQLAETRETISGLEIEVVTLNETIANLRREKEDSNIAHVEKLQEVQNQLAEALANKMLEESRLGMELSLVKLSLKKTRQVVIAKESEVEGLQESIRKLKSEGVSDEKLSKLFDAVKQHARVQQLTQERDELDESLHGESDARKRLEDHVRVIEQEVNKLRVNYEEAQKEKTEAQTRLEVLSNYFKEKEAQLKKELEVQEVLIAQQRGDENSVLRQVQSLQEEVENYRSQNESLKREILDQERGFKGQLATLEKKSHENWVSARQVERKLEESRQEASQLRNRLTLVEKSLNTSADGTGGVEANGEGGVVSPVMGLPGMGPMGTLMGPMGPMIPPPPPPIDLDAPFMFPPLSPGALPPHPHFIPPLPPPPLLAGDRRPPPLGRMSSPPPAPPPPGHFSPPPPHFDRLDRPSQSPSPTYHRPPPGGERPGFRPFAKPSPRKGDYRVHSQEVGNTLNCQVGCRKRSAQTWVKSMVQTSKGPSLSSGQSNESTEREQSSTYSGQSLPPREFPV